jgi:hypothetical protein
MPLAKRRSWSSWSSRPTPSGKPCLPPPTRTGARTRWHLSTRPALTASAARAAPPTMRSLSGCFLQLENRVRFELPLDPRSGRGHGLQRSRIHNLLGRLPDRREVPHDGRLLGEARVRFPADHRLVQPTPVEVGADLPLQVGDERVHLVVRLRPTESALLVLDVAVERRYRRVDQLGHDAPSFLFPWSRVAC